MIMVATGIAGVLLLMVIEADIFQWCSKFSVYQVPSARDDLDMDDDVVAEEDRLSK